MRKNQPPHQAIFKNLFDQQIVSGIVTKEQLYSPFRSKVHFTNKTFLDFRLELGECKLYKTFFHQRFFWLSISLWLIKFSEIIIRYTFS